MLNGLDPILIFTLYKNQSEVSETKIPLARTLGLNRLAFPPVPIYLSETLTGLYIETETKNIDIETTTDTFIDGESSNVNQKPIGVVTKIELMANKNSVGLTLLSALAEQIMNKLTSKEYSITYLHGAVTVFGGLLHSFSVAQESNTDVYKITIEISKGGKAPASGIVVTPTTGTASLSEGGRITSGTVPSGSSFTNTPSGGGAAIGAIP